MTKLDFILEAAISMASKVIGNNGSTDRGDWKNMVGEAEDLADINSSNTKYVLL